MISKEEKQILKAYRKLKEYGIKNIALIDTDRYTIEGFNVEVIETLIKERDYYKQRYLEFNNVFIEDDIKLNTEAMLKDLEKRYEVYRDNTCLHCGEGKPDYCEKCFQELIARDLKLQNKG